MNAPANKVEGTSAGAVDVRALAAQMKETLSKAGLPYKEIRCYGNQIVVTSWSIEAANNWALFLAQFAQVRNVIESLDERRDAKPGAMPSQKYVKVYRTFAVAGGRHV